MSLTLDKLNTALNNIASNRAQLGTQIHALEEQLKSVPKQIQDNIDKATKLAADMDAAIAGLQVVITDEALIEETEAQIAVNLSSPPPAAGGSPAAGQQSATGTETTGDVGSAGLADQSSAAARDSA